jgi:hypothetical protein
MNFIRTILISFITLTYFSLFQIVQGQSPKKVNSTLTSLQGEENAQLLF